MTDEKDIEEFLLNMGWIAHIGNISEKTFTYPELVNCLLEFADELIKKAKEEETEKIAHHILDIIETTEYGGYKETELEIIKYFKKKLKRDR